MRTKHWVGTACIYSWVVSPVQSGNRDEHESTHCWIILHDCDLMIVMWIHDISVFSNYVNDCVDVWIYLGWLCTIYHLNYSHPLFMLLRLWSSGIQIIKYLSSSLRMRAILCLFNCLSFESIVRVTMIRNTRGTSCLIFVYVVYIPISLYSPYESFFKLILLLRRLCLVFCIPMLIKWFNLNYIVRNSFWLWE